MEHIVALIDEAGQPLSSDDSAITEALESLRQALGSRLAPCACLEAAAAPAYVRILKEGPRVAASACTANAIVASQGGELATAFVQAGGLEVAINLMRQEGPILVYIAAAKIVHTLCATTAVDLPHDFGDIISTSLAWCVYDASSDLSFPMDDTTPTDQINTKGWPRERLAIELLSIWYAVTHKQSFSADLSLCAACLRDLLARHIPIRVRRLVAANLMVGPPHLAAANTCGLLRLLEISLQRYVIQHVDGAQAVVPVLATLTRAVKATPHAKTVVKAAIFPPQRDSVWQAKLPKQCATKEEKEQYERDRIHPVDAPPFALRTLLFHLMTDLDPVAKRFATDLLYECCDRDHREFTLRCGLGNAIAFLKLHNLGV